MRDYSEVLLQLQNVMNLYHNATLKKDWDTALAAIEVAKELILELDDTTKEHKAVNDNCI